MATEPVLLGRAETARLAAASILLDVFAGIACSPGDRATEARENRAPVHVAVLFAAGTAQAASATDLRTIKLADGRILDVVR